MSAANPLRDIAALASDAVTQAAQRVQFELRSARVEIKETATAWRAGLALMLAGAVFGTASLFLILEAHVAALIEAGMSPPLATFLVAAICAAVGIDQSSGEREHGEAEAE